MTIHQNQKLTNGKRPQTAPQQLQQSVDLTKYGKVAPQAIDIEKAILGAIMLERTAFDRVSGILTPDTFYLEKHVAIYQAFLNLQSNSLPIDIHTVVQALLASGELEKVGGPYYITTLTNEVIGAAHIEGHAFIVKQKFMQRELIRISSEILSQAYSDTTDVFDLFNMAESELFKINNQLNHVNYQGSATLAMQHIQQVEAMQNRTMDLTGIPTGYNSVDALTCGWQPTDLIILAARPSVGKTAFALNLGLNAARNGTKPTGVGIFSLEMSSGQLTNRFASILSKVPLEVISRGRMNPAELKLYHEAMAFFSTLNMQVDDSGSLNIHQFRTKARQMVSKSGVGMIILDYLQLMSGTGESKGNREQEISTISRNLKALAKELHVPIIALSQLSRANETEKREPQLRDLRESGAIEQDADVVAFLMRDDYGQSEQEKDPALSNKGYLKFSKHRNGTLEKLAFETDLSIQTWSEHNVWTAVNKITEQSSYKISRSPLPQEFDEPF